MTSRELVPFEPRKQLDAMDAAAVLVPRLLRNPGMTANIDGKQYILIDGWYAIGGIAGISAVIEEVKELDHGGVPVYQATASAMRGGELMTRALALCSMDETTRNGRPRWNDAHAAASMAQTRAAAKALRMALGPLVAMSNAPVQTTPAEEMHQSTPRSQPPVRRKGVTGLTDAERQALARQAAEDAQPPSPTRMIQINAHAVGSNWEPDEESQLLVRQAVEQERVQAQTKTPAMLRGMLMTVGSWKQLADLMEHLSPDEVVE